jgi:hypothetical protein
MPLIAIIGLIIFLLLLLILFVGGILHSAGCADEQMKTFSGGPACEPSDASRSSDACVSKTESAENLSTQCSWCQREQAIKAQPNESHGICQRHYREMMADAKRLNMARS